MYVFYVTALIVTFLGIVINLPGSVHINPILLNFYSAKTALFLSTTYLVMGAAARIIIFRKEIVQNNLFKIIVFAICGGIAGGYLIDIVPEYLIILVFLFTGVRYLVQYILKKYNKTSSKEPRKENTYDLFNAGFFVSLMQSFGIAAGALRQGYYLKQGYSLTQIQGTLGVIFFVSGIGTLMSRVYFENSDPKLLLTLLPLFPFILVVSYLGRKVLFKIPKNIQEQIIIYTLIISLLSVLPKLF